MYHNLDIHHGVTVHLKHTDIHNVTVHLSGKSWLCGATEKLPAYFVALGSNPRSTRCSVYLCVDCKRLYRKDHFKLEPRGEIARGSKSEVNETSDRYLPLEEIKVKSLLAPVFGHKCRIYANDPEKLKPSNWYQTTRSLVAPVTRYNPLW